MCCSHLLETLVDTETNLPCADCYIPHVSFVWWGCNDGSLKVADSKLQYCFIVLTFQVFLLYFTSLPSWKWIKYKVQARENNCQRNRGLVMMSWYFLHISQIKSEYPYCCYKSITGNCFVGLNEYWHALSGELSRIFQGFCSFVLHNHTLTPSLWQLSVSAYSVVAIIFEKCHHTWWILCFSIFGQAFLHVTIVSLN